MSSISASQHILNITDCKISKAPEETGTNIVFTWQKEVEKVEKTLCFERVMFLEKSPDNPRRYKEIYNQKIESLKNQDGESCAFKCSVCLIKPVFIALFFLFTASGITGNLYLLIIFVSITATSIAVFLTIVLVSNLFSLKSKLRKEQSIKFVTRMLWIYTCHLNGEVNTAEITKLTKDPLAIVNLFYAVNNIVNQIDFKKVFSEKKLSKEAIASIKENFRACLMLLVLEMHIKGSNNPSVNDILKNLSFENRLSADLDSVIFNLGKSRVSNYKRWVLSLSSELGSLPKDIQDIIISYLRSGVMKNKKVINPFKK